MREGGGMVFIVRGPCGPFDDTRPEGITPIGVFDRDGQIAGCPCPCDSNSGLVEGPGEGGAF